MTAAGDAVDHRDAERLAHRPGVVGHAAAAEDDGAGAVLVAGAARFGEQDAAAGGAVFELKHRDFGGAHALALVGVAVGGEQVLGDDDGALQGRHHREAGGEHGGNLEGGLGDAEHRRPGQLAGGGQAGVAETGDDVGVGAGRFAAQDFLADTDGGDRLVEMAFDGNWPRRPG